MSFLREYINIFYAFEAMEARFPLTPALSLGERENRSLRLGEFVRSFRKFMQSFRSLVLGFAPALLLCGMALNVFAQHGETEADLSAKKLQVAEGLKVETFASDPLFFNPVAFSIDEKGRFFISETHRYKDAIFDIWKADQRWKMADFSFRTVEDRAAFLKKEYATNLTVLTKESEIIRLIEDKDGDGKAETTSIFANGFNQTVSGTAAGILARKGEVWFTCIPDVWKFSYGEDAKAKSRTVLHTGYGVRISVSGHDLHGLVMGPDGKIYFSVGDRGAYVKNKEGKMLDARDMGAVFRCNPDGTELEIFATGLRNPQELAFDQYGNLWAHDNDTSGDDKSRVLYVVEGGDYGWRQSYQFMPEFGPWVQEKVWEGGIDDVLPHSGYGAQGPSGFAYYPGVGLPEKYKNHFLACDFPQGVWSYTFKPKGASYEITEKEKFLWGFGSTDVAFGPDCNVYLSDWGKSYNMPDAGKIYRVFDPKQKENPALAEVKKLLADGMEKRPVEELAKLLEHADMRVRLEAQFELTKKEFELRLKDQASPSHLTAIALKSTNQLARLHAIWGLANRRVMMDKAMAGKDSQFQAKLKSSEQRDRGSWPPLLQDSDDEIRAQVVRFLGATVKHLQDPNPRVRFFAAMFLGKLKAKNAAVSILEMLKENADMDPYLTHAGVWALVNIGDLELIKAVAQDENVSVRRAALLCMRRMKRPEIELFLSDGEPRLVNEAARAINDVPIPEAMPRLAQTMEDCKCNFPVELKPQYFNRAINVCYRLGQGPNFAALMNFLPKHNVPEKARAEALNALADWENPGPLDHVTGLWRPLTNSRVKLPRPALTPLLNIMMQDKSEVIAAASINCARKLQIKDLSPALFKMYEKPATPASLRIDILQALAELKDKQLRPAVEMALSDKDNSVRAEGIKYVEELNPVEAAPMLEKLLETEKDVYISQSVLAALGQLKDSAADGILSRQLDQLIAGKISPELHLDLLEAAAKRNAPAIKDRIKKHETSLTQSDPLAGFRVCLSGGNKEAGKKIFDERDDVGCLRCHAIKGKGGIVGPDLKGVATRHPREYLLESLLLPNKQIAPGYENVVVVMKNKTSYAGMVKSETDQELVLNSTEDGVLTLKKTDIQKRDRSLSAMPEGLGNLLTKRDLRDVVEYLGSLK